MGVHCRLNNQLFCSYRLRKAVDRQFSLSCCAKLGAYDVGLDVENYEREVTRSSSFSLWINS
jgi:hypothetical protein